MGERTPSDRFSHRRSGYGVAAKAVRTALWISLLASAVLALAAGIRLITLDRLPDGTLSLGLAVALGTGAVVWLLIERRLATDRAVSQ